MQCQQYAQVRTEKGDPPHRASLPHQPIPEVVGLCSALCQHGVACLVLVFPYELAEKHLSMADSIRRRAGGGGGGGYVTGLCRQHLDCAATPRWFAEQIVLNSPQPALLHPETYEVQTCMLPRHT